MRRLLLIATLAGGCSLIFDGNDLRGKNGGGDGGAPIDLSNGDAPPPSSCGSDGGTAATLKFAAAVSYTVGITPVALAAGDLDGDGKLDLVADNDYSGTLTILWGDGTGDFSANLTVPLDTGANKIYPRAMALGHLDNDQLLDVVAVGSDQVASTYRGVYFLGPVARAGALPTVRTFATGNDPEGVTIGDFDGDGNNDVVTTNWATDTVSVIAGDGHGMFAANKDSCINAMGGATCNAANMIDPVSPLVADFNGDGKPDIATANTNGSSVSVALGSKALTFPVTQVKTYALPHIPSQMRTADFNFDGKPDLVTVSGFGNELVVLLNNGDAVSPFPAASGAISAGMFGDADLGTTNSGPISLAVADFNGDGLLDIVTGNFDGHNLSILVGKANGAYTLQPMPLATGLQPNQDVVAADFNGDCRPDIAVLSAPANGGTGTVYVLINQSR